MQRAQNHLASYWNLIGNKLDAAPAGPGCKIIGFYFEKSFWKVTRWGSARPGFQNHWIVDWNLIGNSDDPAPAGSGPKGILTQHSVQKVQGYPHTVFVSKCPKVSSRSFGFKMSKVSSHSFLYKCAKVSWQVFVLHPNLWYDDVM